MPGRIAVPADLADADSLSSLVGRLHEAAGPVDVLVNNAAVAMDPSRKLFPGHSSDPAKQPT